LVRALSRPGRELIRALASAAVAFVIVLAALLASVGQLGKIDEPTLVVVLAASAVAAGVTAWRSRRKR
jgi:hypothetical protein